MKLESFPLFAECTVRNEIAAFSSNFHQPVKKSFVAGSEISRARLNFADQSASAKQATSFASFKLPDRIAMWMKTCRVQLKKRLLAASASQGASLRKDIAGYDVEVHVPPPSVVPFVTTFSFFRSRAPCAFFV